MLCSMHPRTRLALLAARAHCRLLRNLPSTQTPADCFGGNNCTESSSNCLGNHSYNSYHTYVKHPAWIYTRMSSQMLLKVPQNPRYQRKLGLALPSYFYTHELSNICTNIKAEGGGGGVRGGAFTPSWWNWPYTESSNVRSARKHEACHILKAFSPKKSKKDSTFHWSLCSFKGVVVVFFVPTGRKQM